MIQLQAAAFNNNKDKWTQLVDQAWIINNMMMDRVLTKTKTNSVEAKIDKTSLTNNNQEVNSTTMDNLLENDTLFISAVIFTYFA